MLQWLQSNLANILIGGVLLAVVTAIVVHMVHHKKKNPHGCSGCSGCGGECPHGDHCQPS